MDFVSQYCSFSAILHFQYTPESPQSFKARNHRRLKLCKNKISIKDVEAKETENLYNTTRYSPKKYTEF